MFAFIKTTFLLLLLVTGNAYASSSILVTGDSISAAYGIGLNEGWVALMQERLKAEGYPHRVINTSVSGETTSGGLARLPAELEKYQPELVIIELGANDGLRGQSLEALRTNLVSMIRLSKENGSQVLLLGMRLPSNYGKVYTDLFYKGFQDVANAQNVALVPFLMEDIALDRDMFQDDGVHPTAAAQPILLDTVWPKVESVLKPEN